MSAWDGPPILAVLHDVVDATVFGSGGVLGIPAGGGLHVSWLTRKRCYRVTLDVVVMPPEKRVEPEGVGARRVLAWERALAASPAPAREGVSS